MGEAVGGGGGGGAGTGGGRDTDFESVYLNHLRLHAKQHIGWASQTAVDL